MLTFNFLLGWRRGWTQQITVMLHDTFRSINQEVSEHYSLEPIKQNLKFLKMTDSPPSPPPTHNVDVTLMKTSESEAAGLIKLTDLFDIIANMD